MRAHLTRPKTNHQTLRGVLHATIAVTLIATVATSMTACRQPTTSSTSATPSPAADCTPPVPAVTGCVTYRSVSGDQDGMAIGWLSDTPITLEARTTTQGNTLVITTPCNTLNIHITPTGNTTTTQEIAAGLMGCDATPTAQEAWVNDFFLQEVQWENSDDTLVLHTTTSAIHLKPDTPTPSP